MKRSRNQNDSDGRADFEVSLRWLLLLCWSWRSLRSCFSLAAATSTANHTAAATAFWGDHILCNRAVNTSRAGMSEILSFSADLSLLWRGVKGINVQCFLPASRYFLVAPHFSNPRLSIRWSAGDVGSAPARRPPFSLHHPQKRPPCNKQRPLFCRVSCRPFG